jgi:hypothetical protein
MGLFTKKYQIAAKIEAEEGTAIALALTEFIPTGPPTFTPNYEMHERKIGNAGLSVNPALPGAVTAKIAFDVDCAGSGSAGTAPVFDPLLQACGFDPTATPATSVAYALISSGVPTITIGYFVDGKKWTMAGCRGNCKFTMQAGQIVSISFEFTGTAIVEADVALLAAVYPTVIPPFFVDAGVALDGNDGCIQNLVLDLGNDVQLRPCANAASGYLSASINGRRPMLTADPEDVLVATEDWKGLLASGAPIAFDITIGSAAGNICTIDIVSAQLVNAQQADKAGLVIRNLEFLLTQDTTANAGDDELAIVFT